MFEIVLLSVASLAAGALNAIAGGGSFLTFPALVYTGMAPIPANATSAVAVFPGYLSGTLGFVKELKSIGLKPLLMLVLLSILGGVLGAVLLLVTPSDVFSVIVPYLLLFATALFAFGDRLTLYIAQKGKEIKSNNPWLTLLTCTYGGYFNGGLGIVLLALFSLLGFRDLNLMNGLKNLLSFILSLASIITFALADLIDWHWAAIMMVSATLGGYLGALLARRLPKDSVRKFIILIGLAMSVAFFIN
ncbi:sulfite exporter TauE/SafE family protein [Terasakiella pusilla]|uniref:sulfite exporter TauE/SafE family protein n=1 Tax=Terasakiella pusilla TaxID=64973 RepID=UPI003AA9AAA4